MGWWSRPGDPDVILGDDVMDETYRYLEALGALYEEALQRKPTVAELDAILGLAMQVQGTNRTFEDLAPEEVVTVTVKKTPRAKPQPFAVGDVFLIPVEGGYTCGRILNLSQGWNLVEIFACFSREPACAADVETSGRLLPLLVLGSTRNYFDNGAWRVVRSDPAYRPDLDSVRFVMGTPGNYQLVKVNEMKPIGRASEEEVRTLPHWRFETIGRVTARIAEALEARGLL